MGNDGGSIPKRRELVKEAARDPTAAELKETLQEKQDYFWTTDPLSNKPLQPPVVSDCAGKLYNKDSILEYLLGTVEEAKKGEYEKILDGNVKSLKDVVEVHFEADASAERITNGNGSKQYWKCPITGKALGAGQKSVYLVPCGHAFSAVAIKELAEDRCQQCDTTFAPNDAITIVPTTEEDIARLSLRMQTLREKGLTHALKKAPGNKKRKKNVEVEADEAGMESDEKVKVKSTNGIPSSGIKNSATASLTARVLAEQEERNKKRKMERSENVSSLFSNNDPSKPSAKNSDFMTRGYIIPANARR